MTGKMDNINRNGKIKIKNGTAYTLLLNDPVLNID
jgi:hypothetical protein